MTSNPREFAYVDAVKLRQDENVFMGKRNKMMKYELHKYRTLFENDSFFARKAYAEKAITCQEFRRRVTPRQATCDKIQTCKLQLFQLNNNKILLDGKELFRNSVDLGNKKNLVRAASCDFKETHKIVIPIKISEDFTHYAPRETNKVLEEQSQTKTERDTLKNDSNRNCMENQETSSKDARFAITQRAWMAWRSFTLASLQRKKRRVQQVNKIEKFLAKLETAHAEKLRAVKKQTEVGKKEKATIVSLVDERKRLLEASKTEGNEVNNLDDAFLDHHRSREPKYLHKVNCCEDAKRKEMPELTTSYASAKTVIKYPVPEFLIEMKKRREERLKSRNILCEKKREEREKKEVERQEREKQIKAMEELAIKNRRKELRLKRREEKEKEERRLREREKVREQMASAGRHHERTLLRQSLGIWVKATKARRFQSEKAGAFYRHQVQAKAFTKWRDELKRMEDAKREKANRFYGRLLLKLCFRLWLDICWERNKQLQAAMDWNDLAIIGKVFSKWMTFTVEQKQEYSELMEIANTYHERKLKTRVLRGFQNYPKIRMMEFIKEKRKHFWRNKIQKIVPDYRPMPVTDTNSYAVDSLS